MDHNEHKLAKLNSIQLFKYLEKNDSTLSAQVAAVYTLAEPLLNGISAAFGSYTMHNMDHSLRVAEYMGQLACGVNSQKDIKAANLKHFSALEIALMLLCAILHDIGMYVWEEEYETLRSKPIPYTDMTYEGVLREKGSHEEAIREIVRRTHADRIRNYNGGKADIAGILKLNGLPYFQDVADICITHGRDIDDLKTLREDSTLGGYSFNPRYLAALLRLADYIDLDNQRTPILWYRTRQITGFSELEWSKHFIIQNYRKLRPHPKNGMQIFFQGSCDDPAIHRHYMAYLDGLRQELEQSIELLSCAEQKQYQLTLSPVIDDQVETRGFKCSDLRLNLNYSAVLKLLMGEHLYGNRQAGLRELIQNAADACSLRRELQNPEEPYAPRITIAFSKEKDYVKVRDNGTGMTYNILKNYFLSVGCSYYRSPEFKYQNRSYSSIGHFGIGFLACFLLSDHVTVKTCHFSGSQVYELELEKDSTYILEKQFPRTDFVGTEITLSYRQFMDTMGKGSPWEPMREFQNTISYIRTNFALDVPIQLRDDDRQETLLSHTFDYLRWAEKTCNEPSLQSSFGSPSPRKPVTCWEELDQSEYLPIPCADYSQDLTGVILLPREALTYRLEQLPPDRTYVCSINGLKITAQQLDTDTTGFYRLYHCGAVSPQELAEHFGDENYCPPEKNHYFFLFQSKSDLNTWYYHITKDPALFSRTLNSLKHPAADVLAYEITASKSPHLQPNLVFVKNGKFMRIRRNYCHSLRSQVFHKGIRLPSENFVAWLPTETDNLRGAINYPHDDLPLVISREKVRSGDNTIDRAVTLLLLKALRDKTPDPDPDYRGMLDDLIAYFQNQENPFLT